MAKVTAPCQYCGSCSIWLAAFEPNQGLETLEQLIVECVKRGCDLEGWITYHVVPVADDFPDDYDGYDDDYDDDDADCYCE